MYFPHPHLHPGIRHFVKSALFEKKFFFLIQIKLTTNTFWLGGIQPLPVLLNWPSAFLSNKGALLLKWRALFGEKFDPILSFCLHNFLILHSVKYSYHIFHITVLRLMRLNEAYAIKMRMLIMKARNWIEMLITCWEVCYEIIVYKSNLSQIKTSFFSMRSIFWKRIFMIVKKYYRYLIFFIKFNYLIGPKIIQLTFGYITYSINMFFSFS